MNWFSRRRTLNLEEAVARQREKLLSGEERVVGKLVKAYAEVDSAIDAELVAVNHKIAAARAAGLEVSQYWLFQQERYRQMLAAVHDQVTKYAKSSEEIATKRMSEVVQLGLFDSAEIAKAAGVRSGFVRLQASEIENVVGVFYDGSPLRKLFSQFPGQATKAASSIFVKGIGLGKNPREIGKDLKGRIENLTLDRAVLIARTESMRAYTTAQAQNYRNNRDVVTGMRIMAAIDARTCPMCWARHGTILPLDAPFHRHPGCRCTLVPVTGFEEDLGIDMRTGDEIMRSRGRQYAEQVLGKERGQLWWDGKVGMADFFQAVSDKDWGPTLKMRTLRSLREVADVRAGRSFVPGTPISTIGTGLPFKTSYLDLEPLNQSSVERGMRAIESVHDLEPLHGIDLAVSGFTDNPRSNGFMAPTPDGVLSHIGLNGNSPPGPSTFVHEFGHLIDKSTLAKGPSPMSIQPGASMTSRQTKALNNWLAELAKTDEVARLLHALDTGAFPVDAVHYIDIDAEYGLRKHVEYLASPAELWARSYAQFIAEKSGDRLILRDIATQINAPHPVDQVRQWKSFRKVGDAVARILRAWGYKVK